MMLTDDVIAFLNSISPFQLLESEQLQRVASDVSLVFYPEDTVILKQNGPPSNTLRVIKKGAVKVIVEDEQGDEIVTEYKGAGDNFGFLSMFGSDRQRTTVIAVEDTLCYVLSKERVHKLLESSPVFAEYFRGYLSHYIDRSFQEMRRRNPAHDSCDRLLFITPVGEIAMPPVTVPDSATIQEAARVMVQNKVGSLVILNENNVPKGIVTEKDLCEKVVAKGRNPADAVVHISNLSLIRADAKDSCFEALMKMIHYNIRHLLIVKEGVIIGIVTNHDLLLLQGTSPVSFAKEILVQESIDSLVPLTHKAFHVIELLLREEIRFANLSSILSEINDRLVRKVIELAEKNLGPPPLPYCWIVLGSEGRKEQIFQTVQDSALIYSDPGTPGEEIEVAGYFSVFCNSVKDSLAVLGMNASPPGSGGPKPIWSQPVRAWTSQFGKWIGALSGDEADKILRFFDARALSGNTMLFRGIQTQIAPWIVEQGSGFLKTLAKLAVDPAPPAGFVGNRVFEKDGSANEILDLAARGISPLVDLIRLFSLAHGLRETSTLGRIRALKTKDIELAKMENELLHAFEFLMRLLVHHQYRQIRQDLKPDALLAIDQISNLDRTTLREAFQLIARLQYLARNQFSLEPDR